VSGSTAGCLSWGMDRTRMALRAACGSTGRGPRLAGRFPPSLTGVPAGPAAYGGLGANTVICGMPVTVFLVAAVCGNFGRAF